MSHFENVTKNIKPMLACLFCATLLAGCATPKNSDKFAAVDSDPIEPVNRVIFQINSTLDGVLIKPITEGYEAIMPDRGMEMVSNALDNLHEPATFVNSVLQLDARNGFSTLWRFMLNSTFGIGGLFDVASSVGLHNRETGLGDTLAIYGVDSGPYLVLPLYGPSSVRDGIGKIGDVAADPVTYTHDQVFYPVYGVRVVDARHRNSKLLAEINKSLDPYTTMRSIYTQHRVEEIKKAIAARKKSIAADIQCVKGPGPKGQDNK